MAFATIQITQGAIVGGNSESVLGLDTTTAISLSDAGGGGATSYLWEVISFPAPDASAPVITNPASQMATITPSPSLTDGLYIVRLTRDDPGDGVSTDVRFFGVEDADGFHLPVAGVNRNMSNVGGSALAQEAGWFGSTAGSTNTLLDAFLRKRRFREARYIGAPSVLVHGGGASTTVLDNTSSPLFIASVTAAATGDLTVDLDTAGGGDSGQSFSLVLILQEGATGDIVVRSGVGGTVLLTLPPPPAASTGTRIARYLAKAVFDGATTWAIHNLEMSRGDTPTTAQTELYRQTSSDMVAGLQTHDLATFKGVGTTVINPDRFPTEARIRFRAVIETTVNTVECRLVNITDGGPVAGSTLSSTSTTPDLNEAVIVLPAGEKVYETQVRITPVGGGGDFAACTHAELAFDWA